MAGADGAVPGLDALLSPDGWPYASTPPVEPGDPGRYHALFGRDSLITALQVLPARSAVARATLRALAALLGRREDPLYDEEPGKVVHEVRTESAARDGMFLGLPLRDGELRYYGSADATPWFLYVLAATGDRALATELEPAWRAAGEWLLGALRRGDGLLRYGPRPPHGGGLRQQGWRDSIDPVTATKGQGILHADGGAPAPPVADADVQAVALVALRALARLSGRAEHRQAATDLHDRILASFDAETMAIDGAGNAVAGAGSQLGWWLWAGVPVAGAAERLCEPDILTDFGLRTLSDRCPQFSPHHYHRGAIWPFDSWLGWGGLRAAGRTAEAERVRAGVLGALARLGRFPELHAVVDGALAPSPLANRVQAWTVGARWALEHGWDGRVDGLCG